MQVLGSVINFIGPILHVDFCNDLISLSGGFDSLRSKCERKDKHDDACKETDTCEN